jgi:hypothetical protein
MQNAASSFVGLERGILWSGLSDKLESAGKALINKAQIENSRTLYFGRLLLWPSIKLVQANEAKIKRARVSICAL